MAADATETTPSAPVRDLGKTPTLLETLVGKVDMSDATVIRAKKLPSIAEEHQSTTKPEEKKKESAEVQTQTKPPEEKPEDKKKREDAEKTQEAEWKKAGETIAEKLFKGRKKAETKAEAKTETKPEDKPPEKKDDEPPAPKPRKRASEAEITERAAAAAAEAATRAVSQQMAAKPESKPEGAKPPEENLTPAERKQFDVYRELETWKPDQYKGVTSRYLKSLTEIQDYVKTWAKENPGAKFDPDDEQHNEFFQRIEPPVDEDDWDDAKANIRAREISAQTVKPLNDKLQQMEQERARAMLEPVLQQKTLQGIAMLINEFDPEIATKIVNPEGLKELREKDPITVSILNQIAGVVGSLVAEVVRLHDTNAGIQYDPSNHAHKEIAEFILGQEARIQKLSAADRMRDGKRFITRFDYRNLPPAEKSGYWFLDQDDITYLLAQKYALQAKKIRDEEVEKFNATAEKLGYKKIDGAAPGAKGGSEKPAQPAKPAATVTSPEAVSRTSVKTATGKETKAAPSEAEVILGSMFQRLRS